MMDLSATMPTTSAHVCSPLINMHSIATVQVRRLKSSVQDLQNALRLVCRMDAPVRPTKDALASGSLTEPSANPYAHILANNDRGVLHGIEVLHDVATRPALRYLSPFHTTLTPLGT